MIKTLRVSKSSIRPWNLYGPVDQAMRTTCQTDGLRFVELEFKLHGLDIHAELWFSQHDADPDEDELNPAAQMMLSQNNLRQGDPERSQPIVKGVAVLTGLGVTSLEWETPHDFQLTVAALLGMPLF